MTAMAMRWIGGRGGEERITGPGRRTVDSGQWARGTRQEVALQSSFCVGPETRPIAEQRLPRGGWSDAGETEARVRQGRIYSAACGPVREGQQRMWVIGGRGRGREQISSNGAVGSGEEERRGERGGEERTRHHHHHHLHHTPPPTRPGGTRFPRFFLLLAWAQGWAGQGGGRGEWGGLVGWVRREKIEYDIGEVAGGGYDRGRVEKRLISSWSTENHHHNPPGPPPRSRDRVVPTPGWPRDICRDTGGFHARYLQSCTATRPRHPGGLLAMYRRCARL